MSDRIESQYIEYDLTVGTGASVGLAVYQSVLVVLPTTTSSGLLGILTDTRVDSGGTTYAKVQVSGIAHVASTSLIPQDGCWATTAGAITQTDPGNGTSEDNYLGIAVTKSSINLDMIHMRNVASSSGSSTSDAATSTLGVTTSAITSSDVGKPAEVESSLAVVHDGTGVFAGVIESIAGTTVTLRRSGIATTSKTDWDAGDEAWISSSDGSWTTTKQTTHDLWVGIAVGPDQVLVQNNDFSVAWPATAAITITMSDSTPGAGVTSTGAFSLATPGITSALVQYSITFGATPDDNASIYLYTSLDGSTYSSEPWYGQEITYGVGATKTPQITVYRVDSTYWEVAVLNDDSGDDITVAVTYSVWRD